MKIINLYFDGLTHQGISLCELDDYRKAIAFFDKAIRKDNKAVVAYYYRGLSKCALNQYEEAIADYDIVIRLYPDDEEVYVNRSLARIALEDYKTAIRDCDEAIRINPHNPDAFEVRGTAKIKSGDAISGNEDIDEARQLRNRWRSGRSLVSIVALLLFCTITTAPAQTILSAEDIAEKALAATVYLEMKDRNGKTLGFGSGFFIKPNLIATNYHVIEGAAKGTAKLVGKYTTYNIEGVTATDRTNDLALLKVTAYGVKTLPLGDSVRIGETVYVAGNPKGLEGTFSDGIISSLRDKDTKGRLQMTAPISPGSSGGPVLNYKGEVIGISFMTIEGGQNLNFAIPSKYLKALLTRSRTAKPLAQRNYPVPAETYFLRGNYDVHAAIISGGSCRI